MVRATGRAMTGIAAWCIAAIALLGQFGRWSDRWDAINIALPWLTLAALIAVVAALFVARRRRGPVFWANAIALLLLVAGPVPLLLAEWRDGDARSCQGERLRIVQFNLWKDNRMTRSAARWIRLVDPDLVMLEEARNTLTVPSLLRDRYPYSQNCVDRSLCSTVILAKRAPLASGGLARGDPENRGGLSAAWMRIASPAGPFTVVAVHFGRPWPFRRFEGERAELIRYVRTQSPATTLVAGDFNLPGWTFQLRRIEAGMGLERRSRALPTWPAFLGDHRVPTPLLALDHLFAGRDWAVEDIRRGPFLGSDHYPLVVDLRRCDAVSR